MSPLSPPGCATSVQAAKALILAPHFDDELLGCGGLLLQLIQQGVPTHVLFLSDSGAEPRGLSREEYSARRRAEANEVAKAVGFTFTEVGLRDGELIHNLDHLADAMRDALLREKPDLVLVPSPLEASEDHRAVFAALHRLLTPLREGDPELEAWRDLRVWAWEGNFPLRPNRLVDISAEVPRLEELMLLYQSQQERRDYWGARLGLARFRALTLANSSAAEGYFALGCEDFRLNALTTLVAQMAGPVEALVARSGPLVSLVVRTKDRPQFLAEALASVATSDYPRLEILVVNDGGVVPVLPAEFPWPIRLIDLQPGRGRAGAANEGIRQASGEFVAFLDDDDIVYPEHFSVLAGAVCGAGVRIAYTDAAVGVYRLEGESGWQQVERRLPYSRDFDPDLLLLDNYIPFHTLIIDRQLALAAAPLDESLPFFEDWDFLIRLASAAPFHHLRQVTCEYRQFRGGFHHILGDRPRERGDFLAMKARVLRKNAERLTPEVLARVVDLLNGEKVELGEALAAARRALLEGSRQHQERHRELEDRFHALNGAFAASQDHLRLVVNSEERARIEIEQLRQDQLARVGQMALLDQKLAAAYEEISRLDTLIRTMESSRLWRLKRWVPWGK